MAFAIALCNTNLAPWASLLIKARMYVCLHVCLSVPFFGMFLRIIFLEICHIAAILVSLQPKYMLLSTILLAGVYIFSPTSPEIFVMN